MVLPSGEIIEISAPLPRRRAVVPTHLDAPAHHPEYHVLPATPLTLGPDVDIPLHYVSSYTHPRDVPFPTSLLTPGPELDNQTSPTITLRLSNRNAPLVL